jgi:hypothetical protein
MDLLSIWRLAVVQDGFEKGHSLDEIARDTGQSISEVVEREKELLLISERVAEIILKALPAQPHRRSNSMTRHRPFSGFRPTSRTAH